MELPARQTVSIFMYAVGLNAQNILARGNAPGHTEKRGSGLKARTIKALGNAPDPTQKTRSWAYDISQSPDTPPRGTVRPKLVFDRPLTALKTYG